MKVPGPATGPATAGAPLLEREQELSALERLLSEASGGASGPVVIEGPAGIGKSRLIAELRERAGGEGIRVLTAHGSHLEREFPFGVVRQLFEPLLADPQERERLLSDAAGPARAVFEEIGAGGGGDVSFAALHGLYWLTANLAGDGPLLLAVDDLHSCDRPSLRFLAYLARRLEGLGAQLVVGLRTAEPGTDPVLIGELVDTLAALHVHPRPLSEAGVAELIRSRLAADPDRAFTAACLAATGGNPLLLRQLLSSLEADGVAPEAGQASAVRDVGPRAVSRTVLLRLRRLPGQAAAVAQAVAVLGDDAELPLVAALAELDEEAVAVATAALARAEILRPDPPLGFVHPLVRDAVYHELPPGERELEHARAADLLHEAGAAADRVAAQLLHAPRRGRPWVAELLQSAARAALARGGGEAGVALLARALDEPSPAEQRPGLLLELGLAETLVSAPAALEHLRRAYEDVPDPELRALAARELTRLYLFADTPEESVRIARRAASELPPELEDARMQIEAIEHMAVFFGVEAKETSRRLEPYRAGVAGEGLGASMMRAVTGYQWMLSGGRAEDCVPLALAALRDRRMVEEESFTSVCAAITLALADRDEALEHWDAAKAAAHRRGSLFQAFATHLWTGFTLFVRGDLAEAESLVRQALEENALWGIALGPGSAYAYGTLAQVLVARGKLSDAEPLLAGHPSAERPGEGENLLREARAELLGAQGRADEALSAAEDLARHAGHVDNPAASPWRSVKASALDRVGRTHEAVELAADELAAAQRWGAPSAVGRALRVLGTLRRDEGIDQLRESVEVLAASPRRLEHARSLAALGAALRRGRRPTEAREPLRRALELAAACSAAALAEQVRSELHAAGARPRTEALSGVDSLTPSERRVADLAAEGRSNREIAQALYVTHKTVEVHLSSAYRKLGIRSRRELGQALVA